MGDLKEKIKEFLTIGSGYGSGYGYGYGSGYGDGDGYGDGYGYGDGSGYGDGLKTINHEIIYRIDGVPTIIKNITKGVARSRILNKDLTFKKCFIVKGHNKFAHGETIKEAMQALEEKIFDDMDTEEVIEEFRKKFEANKKYKGTDFYEWHHNLTGSCKMGRDNFVFNNKIDLNKKFSVKEFIEMTKNSYGGEVIKQLEQYY